MIFIVCSFIIEEGVCVWTRAGSESAKGMFWGEEGEERREEKSE